MTDDALVWRTARARVLAAFDRQYAKGVATYGVPLQPTVDGLDLAEEALSELVDAAVYLQAVAVERDGLRAQVARLREVLECVSDFYMLGDPPKPDEDVQMWSFTDMREKVRAALGTGGE